MLFEIADTIVNSPVPLVITNNNKVEQMNLSYSLIGWWLNNGSSFERIITNPVLESIQKRFGKILPVCHEIPVGGYIQFHRIIQSQHFSDRTQQ